MNLSGDTKVKEIALSNAGAREVLEKAGVDYCCGGDKPLRDACTQSDVGLEEVMDRLQSSWRAGNGSGRWLDACASERIDPAHR